MRKYLGTSLIVLVVCLAVFFLFRLEGRHDPGSTTKDLILSQLRKSRLVAQMRLDLLASVDAEKNAIVAGTDDEAEAYAAKARELDEKVEQGRRELAAALTADPDGAETKLAGEFDTAWEAFQATDRELLGQAVLNTNVKALRLSSTDGFRHFEDFDRDMRRMVELSATSARIGRIAALAMVAQGMTAKILAMQAPHIAEASDARMDAMEREMSGDAKAARDALAALRPLVTGEAAETLAAADTAFTAFEAITAEVVRLSRINSNVKALALSMGHKRRVTATCEEVLETLRQTIDARLSKATR